MLENFKGCCLQNLIHVAYKDNAAKIIYYRIYVPTESQTMVTEKYAINRQDSVKSMAVIENNSLMIWFSLHKQYILN